MQARHTVFDHILFAVLLLIPLIERYITWPRLLARLNTGEENVRLHFYRASILSQWLLTGYLVAIWAGRPWHWLLLTASSPLRLGLGLAVALGIVLLFRSQRKHALESERAMDHARRQFEYAVPLLPHTAAENRLFHLVSVTAGICEELLFRGFLYWYLALWTGPVAAAILSSLIFGLGHIYLGVAHVPKAGLAGLFFACVALASGALWPAMIIHAAMDWNSGELGFRILSRPPLPEPGA
ncbi:MAG: CPBP family intramembrane glutamic endopeptidase [Acidobacteriota bacterium]